jgi:hypothetical protein
MVNTVRKLILFICVFGSLGFVYYILNPMPVPEELSIQRHYMRKAANVIIRNFMPDSAFNLLPPRSDTPLEVIIPIVEKDLEMLPHTIQGVRAMVMHPVKTIYIVAPESTLIRQKAEELGLVYVEENSLLPPIKHQQKLTGWLKQQYLKLNGDAIVKTEHFLVLDADTVFLRPQIFIEGGKVTLNTHRDYTLERKHFVKQALGYQSLHNLCFTVHHMVLEKSKLAALRKALEARHNKPWYDALNELEGYNVGRGFSEYELYANFMLQEYPDECTMKAAFNVEVERAKLPYLEALRGAFAAKTKTLSFHLFASQVVK